MGRPPPEEKSSKAANVAKMDDFDEQNAQALAEMLGDTQTNPQVRLQIISEILASQESQTFFETLFDEEMSLAECPKCKHQNHWLIPEDDLNEMGWVTHEKDDRAHRHTTVVECNEYAEACSKKKATT
jgi:hypothetical protein